jgi:hypothetical protein
MASVFFWLKHRMVTGLAILAATGVGLSWILDVFIGLKPVGNLPVIYDICLAYLTGWIFNLLVVVLPERRRNRAIVSTLRGSLMMIANNGRDLIRDLEFIGQCPELAVTRDHVLKVCTANNLGEGTKLVVSQRLSVARDAYRRVATFLPSLPHDLALAIQEVDQQFINVSLGVPDRFEARAAMKPESVATQPDDLRRHELIWTLTSGSPTPNRLTWDGWTDLVFSYFESTEHLRAATATFLKGPARSPESVEFWINHKPNDPGYPFTEYPPEAFSNEWTMPAPPGPSIRISAGAAGS